MFNYNKLLPCALVTVALVACDSGTVSNDQNNNQSLTSVATGEESAIADLLNLDIGGDEIDYASFCQEEPFASDTTGTFTGIIANEAFSEFSRCEFDIILTIDAAGADNQFCEQTGVLSFTGTQTVSSELPSVCGSISDQPVTIGWNLQEFSAPVEDGSRIELVNNLRYPLDATVNTWDVDKLPLVNEVGLQVEYPVVFFSIQLNEDITISGGDSELYSGVLRKTE